jgi:transcriptional regulator with PAS, ATPase and Fis domain
MNARSETHDCFAQGDGVQPHARAATQCVDGRVLSLIEDSRLAGGLIGASSAWRSVLKQATQVAGTETTTCLEGESGTGKEVVARFIHDASPRRRGPFVAINCAALPEQLLESELFGYERGAFTGAQNSKPGLISVAAGGVLFLDEITEMPPTSQAKFLRVLQEREFLRLGGTRQIKADVRVIAATNCDLYDAVANGRFRADLYYRLNVFDIRIPPLRERREDIALLAASFLRQPGPLNGGRPAQLMPDALEALLNHDWPGNVRELRNVLERATITSEDGIIRARDLSLLRAFKPATHTTDLDAIERGAIDRVLRDVGGNISKAARQLGITRTQLYGRLRKHGLETGGHDRVARSLYAAAAAVRSDDGALSSARRSVDAQPRRRTSTKRCSCDG